MSFLKIKINNRDDLFDINEHFTPARAWFFRGHTSAGWEIWSSFERFRFKYKTDKRVGDIEKSILDEFDCLNRKSPQLLPGPLDVLSKMIFLQHNGCPTRLLDITFNFYTACFFALHNSILSSDRPSSCLWCFNPKNILSFISDSENNQLYENELRNLEGFENNGKYKMRFNAADHFFGNNRDLQDGILLISNMIEPDHQRPQDGGFILAINNRVATHRQLFKLYEISENDLMKEPIDFDKKNFEIILNENNVLQIIIEDTPTTSNVIECEKFIHKNCNKTLENLFKKGMHPELTNLNKIIKGF